jgi:uncharacterized membrane protein YbhN (UPF0104 family)
MILGAFEAVLDFAPALYDAGEGVAGRLTGVWPAALAVGIVLHLCKLAARARAWQAIVAAGFPEERVAYLPTLGAYLSGVGTNAVLPARPGELLKLALVKRRLRRGSYPALGSTLVAESVFDMAFGPLTVLLAIAFGPLSTGSLGAPPGVLLLAVVAAMAAAAVVVRFGRGRLRALLVELRRGFVAFRDPVTYLRRVFAWQFGAWLLRLGSVGSFLAAFHVHPSVASVLVVVAVQGASGLVPVTPGGAGTQQTLLVLALGATAGSGPVLGFGIGMQLTTTLVNVMAAVVSLLCLTGGVRWGAYLAAEAQPR